MKTWIISIAGLIIFIVLSLFNQSSLEKNTQRLANNLYRVEAAIGQKNWPEAFRELQTIQKKWRKIKPVWSLLLHHQEIDAIDQALVRTQHAVRSRDKALSLVEYGSLVESIKHIPKREEFNLVNIL